MLQKYGKIKYFTDLERLLSLWKDEDVMIIGNILRTVNFIRQVPRLMRYENNWGKPFKP